MLLGELEDRIKLTAARRSARPGPAGSVASTPTVWRDLNGIDASMLEQVVIDLDATLVTARWRQGRRGGRLKGGFGHHPLGTWWDSTGEALAPATPTPGSGAFRLWVSPREHADVGDVTGLLDLFR